MASNQDDMLTDPEMKMLKEIIYNKTDNEHCDIENLLVKLEKICNNYSKAKSDGILSKDNLTCQEFSESYQKNEVLETEKNNLKNDVMELQKKLRESEKSQKSLHDLFISEKTKDSIPAGSIITNASTVTIYQGPSNEDSNSKYKLISEQLEDAKKTIELKDLSIKNLQDENRKQEQKIAELEIRLTSADCPSTHDTNNKNKATLKELEDAKKTIKMKDITIKNIQEKTSRLEKEVSDLKHRNAALEIRLTEASNNSTNDNFAIMEGSAHM